MLPVEWCIESLLFRCLYDIWNLWPRSGWKKFQLFVSCMVTFVCKTSVSLRRRIHQFPMRLSYHFPATKSFRHIIAATISATAVAVTSTGTVVSASCLQLSPSSTEQWAWWWWKATMSSPKKGCIGTFMENQFQVWCDITIYVIINRMYVIWNMHINYVF